MLRLFAGLLFAIYASTSFGAIKTESITYKADGVTMKGFLAYDDAIKGKRPGILVVHEWWGANEHARNSAKKLAALGYTALAVDMYGDGKTADHPKTAGEFATAVRSNLPLMAKRFNAAMKVLMKQKTVDPKKIGAIGYCFGGSVVLEMARQGANLKGVVSFHGQLNTQSPAKVGKVKAKILVLTGADDPMVKSESIEAFKKEMTAAKADYKVVVYPGTKHSFTNPDADEIAKKFGIPVAYNATADNESWQAMQAFFKSVFKK